MLGILYIYFLLGAYRKTLESILEGLFRHLELLIHTVMLGAISCLDFNLDLDFDKDADDGVGVEGPISTDNRPKSKSKAALLI